MSAAGGLGGLSATEVAQVGSAIGVLEGIPGAIDAEWLPALSHPELRPVVDALLDAAGRVVVEHRTLAGAVVAYASGWADDIAEALAADGLGVLAPLERAVVALVLLRTVAAPTAKGDPPARWSQARGVPLQRLHDTRRLGKTELRDTVNRLHDRQVLTNSRNRGVRPGPVFDRLAPAQRQRLEEDLFLLAAPGDPVAAALRRRRTAAPGAAPPGAVVQPGGDPKGAGG